MPRQHAKTSIERIGRSQRAAQALELRIAGLTFREIGKRMGFSEQRAHALVTEELSRLNAKRAEQAAAVTRLELERLDRLVKGVWVKAQAGDPAAQQCVLRCMERRAKLLGLDAPASAKVDLDFVPITKFEIHSPAERASSNGYVEQLPAPASEQVAYGLKELAPASVGSQPPRQAPASSCLPTSDDYKEQYGGPQSSEDDDDEDDPAAQYAHL
jgi:hypothetical protein